MFGFGKKEMIALINSYWPKSHKSSRNMEKIIEDYKIIKDREKEDFYLTEQIYEDLSITEVYKQIDRTNSSPGESMLMHMINTPTFNKEELVKRDKLIDSIKNNNKLRDELNYLFFDLNREGKREILSFLLEDKKINKLKEILYFIIGSLPVLFLILGVLLNPTYLVGIPAVYIFNIYIHYEVEAKYELANIPYLNSMRKTIKKLSNIKHEEFKELREEAEIIYNKVRDLNKELFFMVRNDSIDSLVDLLFLIFLFQERQYYKFIKKLPRFRDGLYEVYKFIGKVDAYCSIAALREDLKYYSKPVFKDKKEIVIEDGYHILLEKPIANSIKVDKTGAIITGSNMSGKSTFLKMIALNCLFAQTIYTCTARSYEGDLFYIMTSLNPKEDIFNNTSYYLGEAKAILNIIEQHKQGKNIICFIDEIFRGTNPLERISASRALLKYFHKEDMLCLISTHDIEITQSFEGIYNFYHFEDDVSKEKGLIFDYKVKVGIGTKSNAIKLLEYLGYPEYITNESNNTLRELRNKLSKKENING
ncbi:MutS-related protein [Clostridium intestinale]|uniref:DNA mismatch repair protein MutS n=2 Tax=Clostridium intestinale TaxID=36845 RepID=A0A7D6ZVP6_9CLOT|nr:hypothetical protein [Clostridium intestinale]QLY80953.1 hypothetical protein HZF06_05010 [Clostridium intestinale]